MKNKNYNTNGHGPLAGNNNSNNNNPPQPPGESKPRLVLPLMKTAEDALELCRLEQDNFYLSVFMIQSWLGQAALSVAAEYAEKKEPRTRSLQTGHTSRAFMETMGDTFKVAPDGEDDQVRRVAPRAPSSPAGHAGERLARSASPTLEELDKSQLSHFLTALIRFTEFEDPYAALVREAVAGYLIENGGLTEAAHFKQLTENPVPIFQRLCDWFDAVLHLQTHLLWYRSPVSLDPDRDKRELASLGILQRNFAGLSAVEKAHWHWHFGEAAERFADSPKMSALAAGLASDTVPSGGSARVWNYPDVDTAVITLWPLLKRHNWTYADLLKTIRPTLKRADAHPCDREQSFVTYCNQDLGLRKTGKGRSVEGELPGADVARRLLGLTK